MINLQISRNKIVTSSFVDGQKYVSDDVDMVLDDRIKLYPKLVLKKLLSEGSYIRHREIVDKCIDRLYELGQFREVAELFRHTLLNEMHVTNS